MALMNLGTLEAYRGNKQKSLDYTCQAKEIYEVYSIFMSLRPNDWAHTVTDLSVNMSVHKLSPFM